MKKRFAVFDGQRVIAFVHAASTEEAINLACEVTDGHRPDSCTAVAISSNSAGGRRSSGRFGIRNEE